MSSKKILLLAYAISPYKGSEYSVAWNYVKQMSNDNQLVVLYGASGDHMGDISEMEKYIREAPLKNVRFVPVLPNRITNTLNVLNKQGIFVYTFYFAYHFWHKQAYKVANFLVKNEHYDLIHYLNPIGYREPGFLWKLNLPYMWGPIGGANNVPMKLLKVLPWGGKIKLLMRAFINSLQLRYKRSVIKALEKTDLLLTATTENQILFKRFHNKESIYIPENCIRNEVIVKEGKFIEYNKIHFVWIGSIEARKALIILLESLLLIKDRTSFVVDIIGYGPLLKKLQLFAEQNKLDKCLIWHGNIPRKDVFNVLSDSYLNIITSVSEGNPTTIWEAMSFGVPTMTIDHCGMHDTICPKCGIKIKLRTHRQVVKDFATELERIIHHPEKLKELSDGVIECSKKYLWDERRNFFNEQYNKVIDVWKCKSNI